MCFIRLQTEYLYGTFHERFNHVNKSICQVPFFDMYSLRPEALQNAGDAVSADAEKSLEKIKAWS